MSRILIIEDEAALASALQRGLADERYAVEVCHDGVDGLWAAQGGEHDVVILDVMLPGLDGREICRRLRACGSVVPILMLTARDATSDVVAGLDAGADDYVRKPFAFDELLARVRALLRIRSQVRTSVISAGDLQVDLAARRVLRGGEEVPLTTKEFQVLEYLATHAGEVVSKERLADAVWAHDDLPESNVIEVYIRNLRRKLYREGEGSRIRTIRGAGYVMEAAESP